MSPTIKTVAIELHRRRCWRGPDCDIYTMSDLLHAEELLRQAEIDARGPTLFDSDAGELSA